MSVTRAVRSSTFATYRHLVKVVQQVACDCPLHQGGGFMRYVGRRFLEKAERNRRQYNQVCGQSGGVREGRRGSHRHEVLNERYERFIQKELKQVRGLAQLLSRAPGNPVLTSILQVLSAGVGNVHYQQTMERNYVLYCQFGEKKAERDEVEEEATSDRQNRIMQHALIPYGERLLLLHQLQRSDDDSGKERGSLKSWQVTEAIVGTRSGVSAHYMSHWKEDVVVEVDETFNKQIVYVRCEEYGWMSDVERVEIAETEELRGTVFHGGYLNVALRLCEALTVETPLHAYRSTVLVGHGVGGAVAFCLALLLHARGFDVKNCVTFGAPKAVQKTLERYIHAINPIRVVLEGDPLIELPVTGAEGDVFVHYGEVLMMGSPAMGAHAEAAEGTEESNVGSALDALTTEALDDLSSTASHAANIGEGVGVLGTNDIGDHDMSEGLLEQLRLASERYSGGFLAEHYVERLKDTSVPLTYAEGNEVWDEGDYEHMKRKSQMEPTTPLSQRWGEDLRSPM
uniref:Fungal lipase-type domain-containing protein n=1 Tax=Trypanosoma congolense (strain IL3000) TaxID=1068625 RepID=G0UUX7_TRYCI|nr:conserved hypothetical protein [Trypanosoma congolense IL3000]